MQAVQEKNEVDSSNQVPDRNQDSQRTSVEQESREPLAVQDAFTHKIVERQVNNIENT